MRARPPRPMENPDKIPRRRLRLSSPGGALLLGLGVLVLLAIVAAASRAHHTPGGHSGIHRAPAAVGDYLFSIFAVLMVGTALALVWFVLTERDLLAERHRNQGGTFRALAIVLGLALFAAVFVRFNGQIRGLRGSTSGGSGLSGQLRTTSTPTQPAENEAAPEFKWLPVFLAGSGALMVLGVIGARSIARSRRGIEESFL